MNRALLNTCLGIAALSFALIGTVKSQEKAAAEAKKAAPPAGLAITLDPSFGTGGFVSDLLDAKAQIGALGRFLAVDKEGRPVVAGNTPGQRFSLGRYTVGGKPDPTFADKGKTSICIEDDATVEAAGNTEVQFTHGGAIDAKGRIVIVGKGAGIDGTRKWDFALLRFLPNGQPDKSFAEVGYRKLQAHESWNIGLAVTTGQDCSLLAAGYAQVAGAPVTDPLLIRLNEAGVVDEPFSASANGSLRWLATEGVSASATSVALDPQGRCLVGMNLMKQGRYLWALARLTSAGEIDETFGEKGIWCENLDPDAQVEMSFSAVLDDAGNIVVGGYSDDGSGMRRLAVARITARGKLDSTFGPENKGHVILADYSSDVTHRYGPRATVHKNRIAITGSVNGAKPEIKCFGVAVMDETGKNVAQVNPRLFPGSKGSDQPWGVAFDSEGRVLVGGASQAISGKMRFAVSRYIVK